MEEAGEGYGKSQLIRMIVLKGVRKGCYNFITETNNFSKEN